MRGAVAEVTTAGGGEHGVDDLPLALLVGGGHGGRAAWRRPASGPT